MRQFEFTPGYYEWHLIDKNTGETLHNMCDPIESLFHEDGEPMNQNEIECFCTDDLHCADWNYQDGEEYNGILLEDPLTE